MCFAETADSTRDVVLLVPAYWSRWFLPGWRPFPDVTHEALERLRAVLERAHATVPITIVWGLWLPFWPWGENKTRNRTLKQRSCWAGEERSAFTAQTQSFLPLCFHSCNKATNIRHEQLQELHPLTDVYLNKALFRISATVLPCGALLVSHLQKYQISAVENDRCYGWKHAFIRRSAVVKRNSDRMTLGHVIWPIQSPLK